MKFIPSAWFYWAYVVFSAALVVGLFFSMPVISIGVIALSVLYLIEPGLLNRLKELLRKPVSLWVLAFFLLHVIGILWTEDLNYALKDIRIKLPLLALPLALGTACKLEKREVRIVWWFFLAAALVAAIISVSYGVYYDLEDKRDWSPFISHIRLSLMVILAFFVSLYFASKHRIHSMAWLVFSFLALVYLGFLFTLSALSGLVTLIPAVFFWMIRTLRSPETTGTTKWSTLGMAAAVVAFMVYAISIAIDFYAVRDVHYSQADQTTINGEEYRFEQWNPTRDNGYFVKYYLADQEFKRAWNKRSQLPLYHEDGSGTDLLETAQRYVTSKGLRKDSVGVSRLTDADIKAIESGIPNYLFLEKNPLWKRIYNTIWEIDRFHNGLGASGGSLTQRFVYWQTAVEIIKDHPWFGVGTGDVPVAFDAKYEELNNLEEQYRLRAHNQFLTAWLSLGIPGIGLLVIMLLSPFIYAKRRSRTLLFSMFWIIAVMGMVNEDMLETQVGVTFFAFFFFWILNRGMGYEESTDS